MYKDLERGFASLTNGSLGKYEGASRYGVVTWDFGLGSGTIGKWNEVRGKIFRLGHDFADWLAKIEV